MLRVSDFAIFALRVFALLRVFVVQTPSCSKRLHAFVI